MIFCSHTYNRWSRSWDNVHFIFSIMSKCLLYRPYWFMVHTQKMGHEACYCVADSSSGWLRATRGKHARLKLLPPDWLRILKHITYTRETHNTKCTHSTHTRIGIIKRCVCAWYDGTRIRASCTMVRYAQAVVHVTRMCKTFALVHTSFMPDGQKRNVAKPSCT